MLKKFISLKRIGRFHNYSAVGDMELRRYTLISGANGTGKTTICAILRSLKTGDPSELKGRHTINDTESPSAAKFLLSDDGADFDANFDGAGWSRIYPHLEIFDDSFVTENVHSGEEVGVNQRRQLYRIMIGEEGVKLAELEANLVVKNRVLNGDITESENAITTHLPEQIHLDEYIRLPAEPDIDRKIDAAKLALRNATESKVIVDRPALTEILLPSIPDGFSGLLGRTIENIAKDAEDQISKHLETHNMQNNGVNWLSQGLNHSDSGTCPFCGQPINGLSIIAAYRAVFGDRYKAHQSDIPSMRNQIEARFDQTALANFKVNMERNKAGIEFWSQHISIDAATLAASTNSDGIGEAIQKLGSATLNLIERKSRQPLDPVHLDTSFESALAEYKVAEHKLKKIDKAISSVNSLIDNLKKNADTVEIGLLEKELAVWRATKSRHEDGINKLCLKYVRLAEEKDEIGQKTKETRQLLNKHTDEMIKPYENRINELLRDFNAKFGIADISHRYSGGTTASTYRLVIEDEPVDLGKPGISQDIPSFKNTLSSGDRSTLALAFFLAHLELDPELDKKTVIFDDPFTSQDAFRRRQTVQEIVKMAQSCRQVIVLSHEITFLQNVWDKAPQGARIALSLDNGGMEGSKITGFDLKRACQGLATQEMDDLQTYLKTGEGDSLSIIRKLRPILEAHCWTSYQAYFNADRDWLGEIVRKIRESGQQHPAWHLCDELVQIKEYTSPYHHGQSMNISSTLSIDKQELQGFVRRTLRLVNALHV